MVRKLNWNPKTHTFPDGSVRYCSSACGRGCTKAEWSAAHQAADKELENWSSTRWTKRVWENLGWFWEIKHIDGDVTISKHGERYTCYYNGTIQRLGEGSTGYEAYCDAVKKMIALQESIQADLQNHYFMEK